MCSIHINSHTEEQNNYGHRTRIVNKLSKYLLVIAYSYVYYNYTMHILHMLRHAMYAIHFNCFDNIYDEVCKYNLFIYNELQMELIIVMTL